MDVNEKSPGPASTGQAQASAFGHLEASRGQAGRKQSFVRVRNEVKDIFVEVMDLPELIRVPNTSGSFSVFVDVHRPSILLQVALHLLLHHLFSHNKLIQHRLVVDFGTSEFKRIL